MPIRTIVWKSFYQDSAVLMRIAGVLKARPGVREAAAFMGTAPNQALLEQVGLGTAESRGARAEDLILTVDAIDEAEVEAALSAGRELLMARQKATEEIPELRPRTLDSALRLLPNANLAVISVPGAYAKFEALRALRRGLHVFLFSDNVSVADEVELKQEAIQRGQLCMGPDCGTAYLGGIGLGFFNVVPRGRIGCIAASGTGLQAVASRIAALGEGISQGIGVGGRDLSAEVAGRMTLFALEALAADDKTEAIVLVSKPPAREVMTRLEASLEKIRKPKIVCCLGASTSEGAGAVWVETLDEAADAAVAALRGRKWLPRSFRNLDEVKTHLERARGPGARRGPGLLGLFTGGTLAHEACLILEPLLGRINLNQRANGGQSPHRILDLGDDAYTVGRPHPMIDPQTRSKHILEAGRSREVGVLLVDLVLGMGSHPNPAEPLVAAIQKAETLAAADGRRMAAVASIVGTPSDPQDFAKQEEQLKKGGVMVFPTNAEAARFAALLVNPELDRLLLEDGS